jgi:hypothetical protein
VKNLAGEGPSSRYIQVVVHVQKVGSTHIFSIDPWDNCPSEAARGEGQSCNECAFWGQEVRGIDWSEFSLCLFDRAAFTTADSDNQV